MKRTILAVAALALAAAAGPAAAQNEQFVPANFYWVGPYAPGGSGFGGGMIEGGMDKLQGKKIVNIYHDSAYGKETIPVLDVQAKKYGFQVTHIAVPHPGNEQQAQWLQIRQIKPDWVILRGWGVMNPTALKAAAKIGFPRDRIVGVWWSGAEEDVIPAGDAGKG